MSKAYKFYEKIKAYLFFNLKIYSDGFCMPSKYLFRKLFSSKNLKTCKLKQSGFECFSSILNLLFFQTYWKLFFTNYFRNIPNLELKKYAHQTCWKHANYKKKQFTNQGSFSHFLLNIFLWFLLCFKHLI